MGSVECNCNVMVYAIKRWKYLFCAVVVGFHFRMRRSRMVKTALHFLPSHLASSSSYCYHRRYMCNLFCCFNGCMEVIITFYEDTWVRACRCTCACAFVCVCALQESHELHDMHIQGCWKVLSPTRKETSYSNRRFQFSYILFIIIIGGILVLFIYITRLASNKIFSPSNKIHREVGQAKDLPARRCIYIYIHRGADKSLARPGRKQATATEDSDVHISL